MKKWPFLIGFLLCAGRLTVTAQTGKELDALFNTLAEKGYFNGTVLIAEGGKPVYEHSFGYADFATKRPITEHTMFELASVSKQFTAVAIMQLHEKGKLLYSDSIIKYFPAFPYQGITINHLLHHTSGIPDFLGWREKEIDTARINYNADILTALCRSKPAPDFHPGDSFAYSNTNYVLLALIVEHVSGERFGDYLDKHIFKPLGMAHTKVYPQSASEQKITDYAYGHVYAPDKDGFVASDKFKVNRYQYYYDGVAGPYGISCNARDLLKWDQALYTDTLISRKEQQAAYQTAKLNNGSDVLFTGMPYGNGWLIPPADPEMGRIYMHSGGYRGYMTMIVRYPDKNKTIILLTNIYNVINLYELTGAVSDILFSKPFAMPQPLPFQKSVALSPVQLKSLEGSYAMKTEPAVKMVISTERVQTYAQLTGQPKAEIYAESESSFFFTVVDARIRFFRDDSGKVVRLILYQGGKEYEALKE